MTLRPVAPASLASAAPGTNDARRGLPGERSRTDRSRRAVRAPMPVIVRNGLVVVGAALWFAGLWAQLHSVSTAGTYLVISLLIACVALL